MSNIQNLDTFEKEQVLEFLLHHMSMEVRGKFIRTLPVHYADLFDKTFDDVCQLKAERENTSVFTTEEIEPA